MLPEICSYVCPVEVQCQGNCVQQHLGREAVPIKELQKYVAQRARQEGWNKVKVTGKARKKRVAVVGAGASGIACAIRLLEKGYPVTIFDASRDRGGIADAVIPGYRLTHKVVDDEVDSVLDVKDTSRLEWKLGKGR